MLRLGHQIWSKFRNDHIVWINWASWALKATKNIYLPNQCAYTVAVGVPERLMPSHWLHNVETPLEQRWLNVDWSLCSCCVSSESWTIANSIDPESGVWSGPSLFKRKTRGSDKNNHLLFLEMNSSKQWGRSVHLAFMGVLLFVSFGRIPIGWVFLLLRRCYALLWA